MSLTETLGSDSYTSTIAAPTIGNVLPGVFTIATLPAAAANVRKYAWTTDLFGGPGDYCLSDGLYWKPVRPLATSAQAASNMTINALSSAPTQILTGTLGIGVTATVTLGTTNAYPGAKFRVLRQATGVGTVIGGLAAALGINGWADFEFVAGTGWVQTASGGLL